MKIRKHTNEDKISILTLLRLNTPAYFSPEEEKYLIHYLEEHADNYFVVEIDNTVVGCGGFNLTEENEAAKISWDIIHPNFQRRGIGTELTRFRLEKILEIETVESISVRTSQLVYHFYEKFGLKLQETIKDYWAKGFDMYMLECDIKSIKL